jgi:methyl-accepting chemotaxis protein
MAKRFSISYKIAGLNFAVFLVLCGAILFIGSQALNSEEMRQQATERQELNIRIAWELLKAYGEDFYIRDGNLYAGSHRLNGDYQIVDRVKQLVGGTATIFMHDMRVTTNVMKEDGTRAIGTRLGEGPVYDAIFRRGEPYRGEAIILGEPYFTAYDPVKNSAGEVIGILYVGINKNEFFSAIRKIISDITFTVIVFGLLICLVSIQVVRKMVMKPVTRGIELTREIARGNLYADVSVERKDELGELFEALDLMQAKLTEVIQGIRNGANEVRTSADQVGQGNMELSQRTQEQASSLEEIASSMEEMTSTVNQNADNADKASKLAQKAREEAEGSRQIAGKAIAAMNVIRQSSAKIADIIGVIDEIAFQTNLLALNAAVEAARAGEHGRGFAVVASEVRSLAGRCTTAAKEIKELIQDSVDKVNDGTRLVNSSGEVLEEIVLEVKKVSDIVAEIASASREQSAGINQVNKALLQLDDMTQQNASLVEEAAAASESMGAQARDLSELVSYFKLDEQEKLRSGILLEAHAEAGSMPERLEHGPDR